METDKIQEIESIIRRYPAEKRYILAIMQDLQQAFNYLPKGALEKTAAHVRAPLSTVYSMATFYKAFSLKPKGKINFRVCDGTACHIKGSQVILNEICQCLDLKPGETTPDGMFSLETVNCLGACAISPVLVANQKVYAKVTPAALRKIIKEYGGKLDGTTAGE
ncbi:MAG: NAD(P)H-dependent oxidoreductase subunit E [Bacillota bacterium]|nr:NAD(P)H-dependent oxidoreductase subunit E [Bacillota bacterium]